MGLLLMVLQLPMPLVDSNIVDLLTSTPDLLIIPMELRFLKMNMLLLLLVLLISAQRLQSVSLLLLLVLQLPMMLVYSSMLEENDIRNILEIAGNQYSHSFWWVGATDMGKLGGKF